ncbi:hypothetical protein Shyd_90660 [Streptomyces hydrogenans]|uniref:Uncharacterized protein n=1 Tax=Streptomyces hydrogenans TaxID=1873719 RepID=A0ABQ3PRQ8_9ACTN|nr:hypothetical protein GCM10018784_55150 [Streptomyces hydrogenans]GHI27695.1 hypothetical protein Shyd_90660 [Streptomyces hydrogenans]
MPLVPDGGLALRDRRRPRHRPPPGRAGRRPRPPATVWRSFKDDRSYLYDLRDDG